MRPSGKVIGRILSLGFPLPGPSVDNYTFTSAPAFFDYDAIVIDPAALSALVEGVAAGSLEATTFAGAHVAAHAGAGEIALAALLRQRRDETRRALAHGAVVVCFVHPRVSHDVAGGAFDSYGWLPAEAGFDASALVRAEGTRAHVVDGVHPLASFVAGQLANVSYRAYAEETPAMSVFARSHGGAAIGFEVPALAGRLIFVPALAGVPTGEARYALSDALQAGIRRALGVMAEGRPPGWLSAHALPGLDERAAALDAARRSLDEAGAGVAAAEAAHDALARYRRLLWQEGALGLEPVVLEALRLLGFDVYDQQPAALELRAEGAAVFLEIEASEHAIDLAPHYRLRHRFEQAIAQRGASPRGVIFVNGCRTQEPASRPQEVTDALRLAAETMRYAIAPTSGLFAAVAAKLAGDDEVVVAYRQRIVTEDGLLA